MHTITRRTALAASVSLPLLRSRPTPRLAILLLKRIGHGAPPIAPMSGPLIAPMSRMMTR